MILTVLSALAEPTRFEAVRLLADGSEHCVCELMQKLDATQSRMSRHMQTLKQAGLVVDRRDAQWVRYRLNPSMPPRIRAVVDVVFAAGRGGESNERMVA
jgi:ArsR family transcriptional regulator